MRSGVLIYFKLFFNTFLSIPGVFKMLTQLSSSSCRRDLSNSISNHFELTFYRAFYWLRIRSQKLLDSGLYCKLHLVTVLHTV